MRNLQNRRDRKIRIIKGLEHHSLVGKCNFSTLEQEGALCIYSKFKKEKVAEGTIESHVTEYNRIGGERFVSASGRKAG